MKTSPTQRALKFLRDAGYKAGIVEKFNRFAKVRQDLFGCIDVVAIHPTIPGCLGIQATGGSGGNHAARKAKILSLPEARMWVQAGNRLWLMSWRLSTAKGKRKVYLPRLDEITLELFADQSVLGTPEGT